MMKWPAAVLGAVCLLSCSALHADDSQLFHSTIAPIFQEHCLRCHGGEEPKGDLDLTRAAGVIEGQGDGWIVVPGKPDESYLLEVVSGEEPMMPKSGNPLTAEQRDALRKWIAAGAPWPKGTVLRENRLAWWSLQPLAEPSLPELRDPDRQWVRTPIDAFILARLREQGLTPSPPADRRALIRRLYFDLIGLPPSSEEIEGFVNSPDPKAYEHLVEKLLSSPHYGERWARHWLDVVHYGDTHGYDKDKLRPNAWPYRDYVIRSFNEDKPYSRFVKEQIAGDHFYPHTRDGIEGLGFLAAGPFDWVGHIEVGEGTMEKKRVRNIDRDDMVTVTMNTFVGLTAQCARCHDHKFDPITQEDYYSLQAVFAGIDRADRSYDADPAVAQRRQELVKAIEEQSQQIARIKQQIREQAGPQLAALEEQLAGLTAATSEKRPEFGYHSEIVSDPGTAKWVQVDLGESVPIERVVYVGCHDDFGGIGAGFGFPVRYKIEISDDPEFRAGVTVIRDETAADVPNPGVIPQSVTVSGHTARYVRFTATRLAERQKDYIFALAELSVLTSDGTNVAHGKEVTSLDSIEAPPRWRRSNLVDGISVGVSSPGQLAEIARLTQLRDRLLEESTDEQIRSELQQAEQTLQQLEREHSELPPQQFVFAAATHFEPQGSFRPTLGTPREIFVLGRGNEQNPLYEVGPGSVGCLPQLPARFELGPQQAESVRRAALAEWIVDARNPLTWRSIVNRIWYYHFGRGLVESLDDFGRMGARPTHPELLDWLAIQFRDHGQSIKDLHRMIVLSATYRQSSAHNGACAQIDAGNRYLWRMNRQRLDAESVRDAVLIAAGKLDRQMYGPGFMAFGFQDDHSPHYKYREYDPDDPASHRRAIYRFIVRSVPDPFMETLDCADPSLIVARRNETLTSLQALALLNNPFMVRMAEHFAARVEPLGEDPASRIDAAFQLALGRQAKPEELAVLVPIAEQHSLANVCRLIFNMNEFIFVD